jgi:hypothetical protein
MLSEHHSIRIKIYTTGSQGTTCEREVDATVDTRRALPSSWDGVNGQWPNCRCPIHRPRGDAQG